MRKFEKLQIIKNISSSWVALATNVLVGIFLSPVILHRLGDAAFGIWVLIFSITGYYGLFDFGIRSSVVRYVSKARATGDLQYAGKVISTSLFSYTCIGAIAFLVTLALSAYVDRIFHMPAEFHSTARWLLLMVGAAISLGFPLGIAGGVLEGLQKFYVVNWTSIAATLLRAVFIVFALRRGHGLLTVAFITVILPVLTSVVRSIVAMRVLPVTLRFSNVDRSTFREIATYSGTTLIMIVAVRLRFKSDSIIIGTFLSSVAITYFNIGSRIVDYAGEVVESMAQIFVPMSSHSDAQGDAERLRKIFVAGNRFCAFTIFPICAILIVLGKSLIEVWVGARYVAQSYPILLLLLIPTTLMLAQAASGRVLLGIGKHRTWAMVMMAEGLINIALSIALVRPFGIVGDAIGTAVPLAGTMIFFLPWHVCHQLRVRLSTFLREAYSLPLLICAPVVAVLLFMRKWFVPHNYKGLATQLVVAAAVYGSGMLWAFASRRAMKVGRLQESGILEVTSTGAAIDTFSQEI